jgi:hypothetical protein
MQLPKAKKLGNCSRDKLAHTVFSLHSNGSRPDYPCAWKQKRAWLHRQTLEFMSVEATGTDPPAANRSRYCAGRVMAWQIRFTPVLTSSSLAARLIRTY